MVDISWPVVFFVFCGIGFVDSDLAESGQFPKTDFGIIWEQSSPLCRHGTEGLLC